MAIERMGSLGGSTADPAPQEEAAYSFVSGNERLHASRIGGMDQFLNRNNFLPTDLNLIDGQKLTNIYRRLNATEGNDQAEVYADLKTLIEKAIA